MPWSVLTMVTILTVLGSISTAQEADTGKNVILIGWDGSQRNHVKEMI